MLEEIGRIMVSLFLLGMASALFYWGVHFPQPAQALGVGALGGTIIGSLMTYWLKPS